MNDCLEDFLKLVFHATPIAGIAAPLPGYAAGGLIISLHVADPPADGKTEASYPGYQRIAVPACADWWSIAGTLVSNAKTIPFQTCTGGGQKLSHWAIRAAGAADFLFCGELDDGGLVVSANVAPEFAPGTLMIQGRTSRTK